MVHDRKEKIYVKYLAEEYFDEVYEPTVEQWVWKIRGNRNRELYRTSDVEENAKVLRCM
jgi:hypothetical protein